MVTGSRRREDFVVVCSEFAIASIFELKPLHHNASVISICRAFAFTQTNVRCRRRTSPKEATTTRYQIGSRRTVSDRPLDML